MFEWFRETTDEVARLQSKPERAYSSNQIRWLYRQQTKHRDHARAGVWLRHTAVRGGRGDGVRRRLTDVLETH
ncbi:hypothetical protein GCM10009067_34360 [Haloarcula sebkhae]|uniref:Uncharacterized protein n=1 Tax=Haloarcula sebkhae TaxID=932660 RepID=A0A830EV62_9EURY|nr:hypothetical protein GCM10009067_34360 [Haloarcula sebkhae]